MSRTKKRKLLQDTDDVRKFERLDAIKHKFAAYPPFWYYFGNTATNGKLCYIFFYIRRYGFLLSGYNTLYSS